MVKMNNEEIAVKLTENEQRSKSNTRRIEGLERDHETLGRLVTAVEVIATKFENVSDKVDKIDTKVEALESVPSDKWKTFWSCAVSAFISAVITFLVHKFM
jgi:hypothetical protein